MKITFDHLKKQANIEKHDMPLSDAELIEWETLVTEEDTRKEYSEVRMIGYAFIGDRLHCIVYIDRDEVRKIISLRKANPREVKKYVSEN